VNVTGKRLSDQRIVILGAGSSAIGIADQLTTALIDEGMSVAAARRTVWLVDSDGLVHTGRPALAESKARYAHPILALGDWDIEHRGHITLDEVVRHVRPTILIGTSAQPGAFSEAIVREMASAVERPIIFPLSNPTSKCEATPADLLAWTDGRAIVATGSPFAEVAVSGRKIPIGQCNNAFIFPGVGLGVIASGANRVTDAMFVAAARTLSALSPARDNPAASLYPALTGIRNISRAVAFAVGAEAQRGGHAIATSTDTLRAHIDAAMWEPQYCSYRRAPTTPERAARMLLA
jgi:malate dehydrogenase (oxaloacetate-decarboxylating)